MSRLLFAAARGARVQMTDFDGGWYAVNVVMNTSEDRYRIYPDDEHLQYGPISMALRAAANDPQHDVVVYHVGQFGTFGVALYDYYSYRECADELHRSLFLLILAKALADEGL